MPKEVAYAYFVAKENLRQYQRDDCRRETADTLRDGTDRDSLEHSH